MDRAILFRFHRRIEVCRDRISLLRKLNPGLPVYGMYGGPDREAGVYKDGLGPLLDGFYHLTAGDAEWRRLNFDAALSLWYRDFGCGVAFDVLHYIEWDLLLLESVEKIYAHIPRESLGLTGLVVLEEIIKDWFWFTRYERSSEYRSQWKQLLAYVKKNYGYNMKPCACVNPGGVFPRRFIDKLSSCDIPQLCHEEVRIPLFAQVFGFRMSDTRLFFRGAEGEREIFNCLGSDRYAVKDETIARHMKNPSGRRAFHPVLTAVNAI